MVTASPRIEEPILSLQHTILGSCRAAGLSVRDSEELAQELWLWLLRRGLPLDAIEHSWLRGAVHYYILRFRRRQLASRARETVLPPDELVRQAHSMVDDLEHEDLLDHLANASRPVERDLLFLVRNGHSLTEAFMRLKIPLGSRSYYKKRLLQTARLLSKPRA